MIECLKNLLIFLKNSHSLAINTEKYVREKKGSAKNG